MTPLRCRSPGNNSLRVEILDVHIQRDNVAWPSDVERYNNTTAWAPGEELLLEALDKSLEDYPKNHSKRWLYEIFPETVPEVARSETSCELDEQLRSGT